MIPLPHATDRFLAAAPSWDVFFKKASALPASAPGPAPDKGKVFERLTQLYLKTHPEYQTRLRKVWRVKDELPPAIRKRIGLPRTDEGIDLVAETLDGDLWAIQCKFRAETRQPLTVTDLATFANLSFNVCKGISLAVVAHTCAKPVRKTALLPRTTEIGLDRWLELDAEDWRRILAATTKAPPPPRKRAPRPHQKRAIAAAKAHFVTAGATRGRLIMPCGTGKSLTAFWIAEAMQARSILVAVPSLSLIKQSLADWTREFLARGEVPDWLCVCSDESTGRLERDEFVGGVYELGVDATTDPKAIGKFLARKTTKRKVVFATYQSGARLAAAARAARFSFDLGIMDEAHRTVGSPDKSFGHLLLDKNLPVARRLFMTATERVVRGADDTVLSMDDPKVYGECFHQLTFKDAIRADPPIISDYKILTITVSDEHVRDLIAEKRFLRTSDAALGEREAQALAAGIALQRAFQEEGVRHAISFHRSIRAAEEFRAQQERIEAGRRWASRPACFHISSRKTAGERADLLREFRDSPSALITNARCLQEGVDIPSVGCVLFADPKQSVVDIVQAAGRAMRPSPGKRYGYIVIPIVVPAGMEFDQFAETTEFKQVARVVTALSTQDDRIAEEFRGLKAKNRRRGDRIVEIAGDVPMAMRIDLEKFREQVRLKLWERIGRSNWRFFEEARALVHSLRLKNQTEWYAYSKGQMLKLGNLPPDIPATPSSAYSDKGWVNWGDWLGTGTIAARLRSYQSFQNARAYARSFKFKNQAEWYQFCRGEMPQRGRLPADIPATPSNTYASKGWVNWGDWLGTGTIANSLKMYQPFPRARAFARSLNLKSVTDWRKFCNGELAKAGQLPVDIPSYPEGTYFKKGWVSYGDWLGSGNTSTLLKKFRPFKAARAFSRRLNLRSGSEWRTYCRGEMPNLGPRPVDIPSNPNLAYRGKGWKGMGDWLGTGSVAPQQKVFRGFLQARAFVRKLELRSVAEWLVFSKGELKKLGRLPPDIPVAPEQQYAGTGWKGWGDWLGTGAISNARRQFKPFQEAREFARSLRLRSGTEWRAFCKGEIANLEKLPRDIPSAPNRTYANKGWMGMGDWLGTGTLAPSRRIYRPFNEARAFVRNLHLTSGAQWIAFRRGKMPRLGRLPMDIPANPEKSYVDKGWKGMGDWLGTGTVAPRLRVYRPFAQARVFAHGLKLRTLKEWRAYCKGELPKMERRPADIPAKPDRTYAGKGWKGTGDWLGTGTIATYRRRYRHFANARSFARSLGLKDRGEWLIFSKSGRLPADIPAAPDQIYSQQGWIGFGDWLGNHRR